MIRLPYTWLDVFAVGPLTGNQLMAFVSPADLPPEIMAAVARETNHAEATFLQPPTDPNADVRVRIFIPTQVGAVEVPFAGHPLLGSACAHVAHRLAHGSNETVRLQTEAGMIPVRVAAGAPGVYEAAMSQPLPQVLWSERRPELAPALGLHLADLHGSLPVEAVDNGMQTVIIPLASADAVRRARPDLAALREFLGRAGLCTLIFGLEGEQPLVRVFSPFDLVTEDPATGSAVGPLGEYLVRHGAVRVRTIRCRQGEQVGRPSELIVTVERSEERTLSVQVGGHIHLIGAGEFRLAQDWKQPDML